MQPSGHVPVQPIKFRDRWCHLGAIQAIGCAATNHLGPCYAAKTQCNGPGYQSLMPTIPSGRSATTCPTITSFSSSRGSSAQIVATCHSIFEFPSDHDLQSLNDLSSATFNRSKCPREPRTGQSATTCERPMSISTGLPCSTKTRNIRPPLFTLRDGVGSACQSRVIRAILGDCMAASKRPRHCCRCGPPTEYRRDR